MVIGAVLVGFMLWFLVGYLIVIAMYQPLPPAWPLWLRFVLRLLHTAYWPLFLVLAVGRDMVEATFGPIETGDWRRLERR